MGNYVIVNPSRLGNYVIADNQGLCPRLPQPGALQDRDLLPSRRIAALPGHTMTHGLPGRAPLLGPAQRYVQYVWRAALLLRVQRRRVHIIQRLSRNARSRSPGRNLLVVAGVGSARRRRVASLVARSASRYWWVVAGSAWPSHKAMTARSVPDCNRCMAVEWRSVCGDTCWPCRDGQCWAATATARSSRSRTPDRVRGAPARLGNTGASGTGVSLRSQPRRSVAVDFHSGITRSLRPLPCRCTAFCRSRSTSRTRRLVISETRAPVL